MSKQQHQPYISADKSLPEITVKGVLLSMILSAVLAAANAYLGLFAGMTVSASIPAAVISMAILRLFKTSNILENNAVQTAASAGESLAAGVIFTFPALILMGYWTEFNYWETTFIALCGGILGVLFTIPLRSALIVRQKLKFPEGVATAEVLKTGTEGGKGIRFLLIGGLIGAVVKLAESGFKLWEGIFDKATLIGNKGYAYFGINSSPALVAVGYIVGLRIASLVFIGGAISWWIAIPIYIALTGAPEGADPVALGYDIWNKKIRYVGAGAMLIGGLWALVSIRESLSSAVGQGLEAFKSSREGMKQVLRTDQDTPMPLVLLGIAVMIIPVFLIAKSVVGSIWVGIFMAIIMVIAGFLFSAVAGYMAGLVGSSNNPISGVTIATILTSSLLLLALIGTGSAKGPVAAIIIGAVVCCAAAIAGDNMQDLKAGNVLGATPRKQQIMQIIGVVSAAVVIAPVLSSLNAAYGFGPKTEANPDALAAPQATLMQSVADGVFGGNLPWDMIIVGIVLGILVILADIYQEKRGASFRIPVLAVAVGLYLPFELDSAIMLGGVLAWLVSKYQERNAIKNAPLHRIQKQNSDQAGLLFASGLITGEALIGIGIAIPVAQTGNTNVLALLEHPMGSWLGVLIVLAISTALYWIASRAYSD